MTELVDALRGNDDAVPAHRLHREPRRGRQRQAPGARTRSTAGDPSGWAAQKRATLGLAIALTTPGIPMLFQGQEFLEDEWFRDDVPLDWERAEQFRDIVRLGRDLIHLRRDVDGVSRGLRGEGFEVLHLDDEAKAVAWARALRRRRRRGRRQRERRAARHHDGYAVRRAVGGPLQLRRGDLQRPLRGPRDPRRGRGGRAPRRPARERHRLGGGVHPRRAHPRLTHASRGVARGDVSTS